MARKNASSYSGLSNDNQSLSHSQVDGPSSAGGSVAEQRGRPLSMSSPTRQVTSRSRSTRPPPRVVPSKNIDIGPEAYATAYEQPHKLPLRPGFNPTGKPCAVAINSYKVTQCPSRTVYQYDVLIGNGAEKRIINYKVFTSKVVQGRLGNHGWVFDGSRLAWASTSNATLNLEVDLDAEKGESSRRSNKFRIQMRQTSKVNLEALQAYLNGQAGFSSHVLECINFIDQMMRVIPSERMLAIKRSFYDRSFRGAHSVGAGIVAIKGVYQSLRMGHGSLTGGEKGAKLLVNADVANTCFWDAVPLLAVMAQLALPLGAPELMRALQKTKPFADQPARDSKTYLAFKKLNRIRIQVNYNGASERIQKKTFTIQRVLLTNPKDTFFKRTDKDTGKETQISVLDYFGVQYGHKLRSSEYPCVEMQNGAIYPAEVCRLVAGQRYPYKLSEDQTAAMIKFAVTRPGVRAEAISAGLKALDWPADRLQQHYGMKIETTMVKTNAKLLQAPLVEFGQKKTENPQVSGRWRIDGKQFIQKNPVSLKKWAVVVFNNWGRERLEKEQAMRFTQEFVRIYRGHGGDCGNPNPDIIVGSDDIAASIQHAYQMILKTGSPNERPQLILCMVSAKNIAMYQRVKKNCDCRFGIVSQVVLNAHVKRCQPQYISNVLMKVNAKLGGFAFRALPQTARPGNNHTYFKRPTLVMGADVSHSAPGTFGASMAAVTVSMDRFAARYAAACQSNGHRVEMISPWNINEMLQPLFTYWVKAIGGGKAPQHVIYIRDGVSEGQYEHVIQQEVRDIKAVWEKIDPQGAAQLRFTVIIAAKRHHIRMFPAAGHADNNGNPHPGTLVERDVTHPYQWDFYLNAHKAIQGTARPVHYHVIQDEAGMAPAELINMIYEQSYQYARSSTPVSIHPAVYYAHLAAKRAAAHERGGDDSTGGRSHGSNEIAEKINLIKARDEAVETGKKLSSSAQDRLRELTEIEYPRLIPMAESLGIRTGMWFI